MTGQEGKTFHEPDDELVRRYVAGTATPSEAETFEEHYFGCELCWREVQTAMELREALLRPSVRPGRRIWPALAAAAAAAFLFVGIWQMMQRQADQEPAWRSSQPAYQTSGARVGSSTVISWEPKPEARWYVVRRFSADGSEIDTVEIAAPRDRLELPLHAAATHYRVQALDQFRSVLADSGLQRLE